MTSGCTRESNGTELFAAFVIFVEPAWEGAVILLDAMCVLDLQLALGYLTQRVDLECARYTVMSSLY